MAIRSLNYGLFIGFVLFPCSKVLQVNYRFIKYVIHLILIATKALAEGVSAELTIISRPYVYSQHGAISTLFYSARVNG